MKSVGSSMGGMIAECVLKNSILSPMALKESLLPATIDNTYRGHQVGLVLFGLVVLLKTVMSLNSMFNTYSVATSADNIPLDQYPPAAAATIVSLFAMFALSNFVLCVLCILTLVRYQSIVPFMFAVLLLEHLGRRVILEVMPIVRTETPPGYGLFLALIGVMIVGFALSLWGRGKSTGEPAER